MVLDHEKQEFLGVHPRTGFVGSKAPQGTPRRANWTSYSNLRTRTFNALDTDLDDKVEKSCNAFNTTAHELVRSNAMHCCERSQTPPGFGHVRQRVTTMSFIRQSIVVTCRSMHSRVMTIGWALQPRILGRGTI